jgi:transposase
MTKNIGGRPSKYEIVERRNKVKELYLKGKTIGAISKALDVSYPTIEADVRFLQAHYTKLVLNNPHLAEKQFAKVEQLLEEINIIKEKYWSVYEELEQKVEESKRIMESWETRVKEAEEELKDAEASEDKQAIRAARKKFDFVNRPPRISNYINARIDTLKAVLDRIDKESKLLSLFNPQQLIEKNYVSIEALKGIMEIFKGIVIDLIPEDRRAYAFKRLKTIDVQAMNTNNIVEDELLDQKHINKKASVQKDIEDQRPEFREDITDEALETDENMNTEQTNINLDDVEL